MRSLFVALALTLALPTAALVLPSSEAHAQQVTKATVKADKDAWKLERKKHREFSKLSRKWQNAWQRGNEKQKSKFDVGITAWMRGQLQGLRQDGVPTREAGSGPGDMPLREQFRDMLVELRGFQERGSQGTIRPQGERRKAALLDEIDTHMKGRVDRRRAKFDRTKIAYKNK